MNSTSDNNDRFSFISFAISTYCDLIKRKSAYTTCHYFSFIEYAFRWDFKSTAIFLPAWGATLSSLNLTWIWTYIWSRNTLFIFFRVLRALSILILRLHFFFLSFYYLNLLFFVQNELSHFSESIRKRVCKIHAVIVVCESNIELQSIVKLGFLLLLSFRFKKFLTIALIPSSNLSSFCLIHFLLVTVSCCCKNVFSLPLDTGFYKF